MNFKKSESVGKVAEMLLTKLLTGCGLKTTPVSIEDRKFWDLSVALPKKWNLDKTSFTIEVKHDVYQQKSGNIAVETWNSKKNEPSGVTSTKADLWCFVLSDSIWISRVGDLRNYVNSVPPKRLIENAGDGNATLMLYESDEILNSIFTRIDNLSRKAVMERLKDLCSKTY